MGGILGTIFSLQAVWVVMWALYVPTCIALITMVLLQKTKGAGFAGAFGLGPGSDAVFGPRASKSLPVRLTQILFGVFIVFSLIMSLISGRVSRGRAPEEVDAATIEKTTSLGGLDDLGIQPAKSPEAEGQESGAAKPAAETTPAAEAPTSAAAPSPTGPAATAAPAETTAPAETAIPAATVAPTTENPPPTPPPADAASSEDANQG